MSETILTLDDVSFRDFEAPSHMPFGGAQGLAVHELPGGGRVIDAMGAQERPIHWTGKFRGKDALDRALYLNQKRKTGLPYKLTWGRMAYTVAIEAFEAEYEASYEIPYEIRCIVVSDDASPASSGDGIGLDDMIGQDIASANTLTAAVKDSTLTSLMGTVNGAIAKVSSFANATQAVINSVVQPIAQVQAQVTTLLASTENSLLNLTSLGGILPGNPVQRSAAGLLGSIDTMQRATNLVDLQSVLGRASTNISSVGTSGAEIVKAGGSLYQMALDAYGKAEEWTTIAAANGLTDPTIVGVRTILVPPTPRGAGGVLVA